jgi:acetyl-CoA carboxylase biotin carboxyl carrier protein
MLSNKEIKDLMKSFDSSSLSKLKISKEDFKIEMEKGGELVQVAAPVAVAAPAPAQAAPVATPATAPVADAPAAISGETINSEMVGTFYAAPSPDAPNFVKAGDTVKKGQTLCILEAMKIMNEIEAEFDCKILDILVDDGSPVEFDMPLFAIEKL